jgi:hypothetical protein
VVILNLIIAQKVAVIKEKAAVAKKVEAVLKRKLLQKIKMVNATMKLLNN